MTTKIIGLGFSKTGTTSLRVCFQEFGLNFIGFDPSLTRQVVAGDVAPAIKVLASYEAAANWPWPFIFREIDSAFPQSKFILTVRRDSQTWLRSLMRQAEKKPHSEFREWVYGHRDPIGHEDELITQYEAHNEAVRRHFATRPDQLLEVCWESGNGWTELCDFLGYPVPAKPFPRANPSAPKTDGRGLNRFRLFGRIGLGKGH